MISHHKTQQSIDHIARTVFNVSICRTFLRSVFTIIITRVGGSIARIDRTARKVVISRDSVLAVLLWGIDCQWTVTERLGKYRPRIVRVKFRCFAGLFLPLGCRGRCGRYFGQLYDGRRSLSNTLLRGRLTHNVCDIWLESA